jgi:transcriptional regulator with AAA-type ATPase domain
VHRNEGSIVYRLVGEVGGVHHEFILAPGEHRVGSHVDNELCVRGSDVSRRHAVLHVNNHTIRVEDLRSTNGTFVNGVQVTRSDLADGDWLQFGSTLLTLERTDRGETTLAIEVNQPAVHPAEDAMREERTTRLGTTRDRYSRRLALANRVVASILQPVPDIETALALLREGLGADAVALLELDAQPPAVIRALAGGAGSLDHSRVQRLLEGPHFGADSAEDRVRGRHTVEGEPLLVVARRRADHWDVLVIAGGDLDSDLVPLSEILFRIFLHALPDPPGEGTRPHTDTPEPLVFPDNHVKGTAPASRRLYEQLQSMSGGTTPMLITGETGVGKEHVVRILHASSDRADGPLRVLNCAAIPADLLEAELFGIEAGVATGVAGRKGAFREADGGTLFFDEIGAMPLALQAKLLRALQSSEVHPVGARQPTHVDVRIVAATNTDLAEQIRAGNFRSDLYYRIAGCEIAVAPLRKRREDIPALVSFFLERCATESTKRIRGLSVGALAQLQNAVWPGNIRQLEHEILRLVSICSDGATIESSMISPEITAAGSLDDEIADDDLTVKRHVDAIERRLIRRAVDQADGNLAQAARLLGLSRNGLVMKMGRLGITHW